jgi:hypothetical protein
MISILLHLFLYLPFGVQEFRRRTTDPHNLICSFQDGQATIRFVDHSLVRVLCPRDLSHGTRVLLGQLDLQTINRPITSGTNTAILQAHSHHTSPHSRSVTALLNKKLSRIAEGCLPESFYELEGSMHKLSNLCRFM